LSLPLPLLATPYSLLPTPYSLLPTPYSLLPTPYSLLPVFLLQLGPPRGLMPIVQKIPLHKHDRKEEGKPKSGCCQDQREKIIRLELRTRVLDRVADP